MTYNEKHLHSGIVVLIRSALRSEKWFMKEQSAKIHGAGLAKPGTGM
ncbi:MAG: hypothetical protein H5U31_10655 [Marinobacter sp.]|nr:hypothetical protein [Marinobacter sp.]